MGVAAVLLDNILEQPGSWLASNSASPHPTTTGFPGLTETPFPVSNLALRRAGKVARFKAKQTTQFGKSFSSVQSADTVAIFNHNLTSGTIVWLYGANSLAGPWTSRSIVLSSLPYSFSTFPSLWSFTHWRIVFPASTTDGGPVQLGEWWLGRRQELPPFVWGAERGHSVIDAFQATEYGVVHTHFLSEQRSYRGALADAVTDSEKNVVEGIKRTVQGRVKPFVFIPDVDGGDGTVLLGRLADSAWNHRLRLPGRVDNVDFAFTEDPWGRTGA